MDQEVAGQDLAEYEVRRHAEEGDDFLDGVEVLGGQKEGDFALEEYIVAEAIVSDKEEDRLTHFNRVKKGATESGPNPGDPFTAVTGPAAVSIPSTNMNEVRSNFTLPASLVSFP